MPDLDALLRVEPYETECIERDATKGIAPKGSSMTRAEWDRRYLLERLMEIRDSVHRLAAPTPPDALDVRGALARAWKRRAKMYKGLYRRYLNEMGQLRSALRLAGIGQMGDLNPDAIRLTITVPSEKRINEMVEERIAATLAPTPPDALQTIADLREELHAAHEHRREIERQLAIPTPPDALDVERRVREIAATAPDTEIGRLFVRMADTLGGLREALEFVADWAGDCAESPGDNQFFGFTDIELRCRAALAEKP